MDKMYTKESKDKVNAKYHCNVSITVKENKKKRATALIEMITLLETMTAILKEIAEYPMEYSDYYQPHRGFDKSTGLWDMYTQLRTALKMFMPMYRELGTDLKRDKRKFTDIMKMKGE